MKLSILDQLPIREGGHPKQPIDEAIELAQAAEEWGYHRYWTAQFHATNSFTSAAPELVACRLAAETKTIRVGSGGILLSGFSPYVVAEQFKMLETFYPGRIDLGIGRTTGADGSTFDAVLYGSNQGPDQFVQKVEDLKAFVAGTAPTHPAWKNVKAKPDTDHLPEMWLLGSGETSAAHASEQGLALSFAHFINPYIYADVLADYRKNFKPSALLKEPKASLAVYVICCETEEEAIRQRSSRDLWWIEVFQGLDPPYRSVDSVLARGFSAEENIRLQQKREAVIVGTPEQVKQQLLTLADRAGVDELVIQTMLWDFNDRKRSFQWVAEQLLGS